jgi:hypothetical protein
MNWQHVHTCKRKASGSEENSIGLVIRAKAVTNSRLWQKFGDRVGLAT